MLVHANSKDSDQTEMVSFTKGIVFTVLLLIFYLTFFLSLFELMRLLCIAYSFAQEVF